MNIANIVCLCLIVILFVLLILIPIILKKILDKMKEPLSEYLDIKNKDIQNKEYELFNNFDIKEAKNIVNDLVDDYIANYALYNFSIQDKQYIGQEDAELMIKEVTKALVVNVSDYHLFLLKMLRGIKSDEDLVLAIRDIVKDRALMYITESNKPS